MTPVSAQPAQRSRVPERALFEVWPELRDRLPLVDLGALPTPIDELVELGRRLNSSGDTRAWIKRDDLTSPIYGGNKVRTLEVLFGAARAAGATRIIATGAFGSNHAVATALHARRVGLQPEAMLFPQPASAAALANLQVALSSCPVRAVGHWSLLGLAMRLRSRRAHREPDRTAMMVPGGATPLGALGYVSAALELAQQVRAGELPAPRQVIVGVGSTCTSAGLLVGFHHAARLGIGFDEPPELVSVRVTPWPVTSPWRIVDLAVRTSHRLAQLVGDGALSCGYRQLRSRLEVDGRFLGSGYGRSTAAGREAIDLLRRCHGIELDTTYSGKAAAALIDRLRTGARGPLLFWSTRSTAPLPEIDRAAVEAAPRPMRRWIARCARRGIGL